MVIILNDYTFFPRGLPFSHCWNLTLVISENKSITLPPMNSVNVTSLGRSLLGISFQSLTDSPGSNGGVLDVAEIEIIKYEYEDDFMGTYLRPAALQNAVILSEIWNILVWEDERAASRWQGASAEVTAAMIEFWTFSKIVNCRQNTATTIWERGRLDFTVDCTQTGWVYVQTVVQVQWGGRSKLCGVGLLNHNSTQLQSYSKEWNNCEN